jgi:glycosyltransferase involved in cell wall biosynthesis
MNSENEDLVSVIIPSYNRFIYLLQAVQSVLHQTYKNIEVIIVDDCSTQKEYTELLPSIIKKESRIKLIRCEENMRKVHNTKHAQGMTRNEGMKIAKGKYIAFLDDDDFWLPNKLEIQIKILKEMGEKYGFCSTNMMTGIGLFKSGTYGGRYFNESPFKIKLKENIYEYTLEDINIVNYVINSSVVMKRNLIENAGYQTTEVYEDWVYWKKVLEYTKGIYIDEVLVGYDMSHGGGKQYE